MTTFKYSGFSREGAAVSGVVRAYDEFEAVTRLRETCSIVTKIEVIPEKEDKAKTDSFKIKDKDLAIMCSQLSIILSAGMPVVQCVRMVAEQAANKELRVRLMKVAEDIDGGHTMAQSFQDNVPGLPTTFVETVHAGEDSGTLEDCFARLHKYYDKASKTKGKVSGALTYPAIVIAVAVVVFIIIMVVAVPMFKSTFEDLGVELPFVTRLLIGMSNFFTNYWWLLLLIIAFAALVFTVAKRTESGKVALADFALNKAPLHKIKSMTYSSTFASTMSTMVAAGLPLVNALEITSRVIDNYVFSKAVYRVKEGVEQGRTILECMRESKCFPKLLTEMCGVGEQAGSMQETLDVVGDFYDNEVQLATDKLLAAMEPIMTIGLAVVTVVLLLAVYLPMFSMYGSVT